VHLCRDIDINPSLFVRYQFYVNLAKYETPVNFSTRPAHLVRSALEAVVYQTRYLVDCFSQRGVGQLKELRVDGGMTQNQWLMQFLSD